MKTLNRFWMVLEVMPGLSSVLDEWRHLLADEYEAVCQLLRPTHHRADVYPCPSPGGDGCPRRVVELGAGNFVAVCADSQKGCRDIPLIPADLVVHELDRRKLGLLAALALGVNPVVFTQVASLRETFRVGEHHPRAGDRFPVFMTLQQKRERLRDIAFHLYRTEPNPFILLMPTDGFLDPDVRQVFSEKKSRLFALGDVLGVDDKATLVPTPAAADMLAAFHTDVFINANSRNRFPTPPDAQWPDIKIRFLNRDTVSIQCQGIVRTATYMDMGMVDTRSGRPTEQWLLLNNMADAHGHIGIHSTHAKQENKKRKQNLIKALRSYFGIAEDPMPWNEEASAYITRFALEP